RNLARNPHCILTTGNNAYRHGVDVVVEGQAERVTDDSRLTRLAALWEEKLDWPYDVAEGGFAHRSDGKAPNVDNGAVVPVFGVRPAKILAFGRGERFSQTRYLP